MISLNILNDDAADALLCNEDENEDDEAVGVLGVVVLMVGV